MKNKEKERIYQHEYYLRRTIKKREQERLKRPLITKVCKECGKEFLVDYKHQRQLTCSEECRLNRAKRIHKEYRQSEHGKEVLKAYTKTEKYKEGRKKIDQSLKRKNYFSNYWKSERGKEVRKAYSRTEKYKKYQREYAKRKRIEKNNSVDIKDN